MKQYSIISLKLTLICVVVFAMAYPFLIWSASRMFPGQGTGRVIVHKGHTYYQNVGQSFKSDRYFNSRPSAVNYNAAGSGGSNKGPTNPEYLADVSARIDTFLAHNPEIRRNEIPSELVTASGSGLDPDISPEAAMVQVPRIASVRNISEQMVKNIIESHIQKPVLGMLGVPRINVLQLNLALDEIN